MERQVNMSEEKKDSRLTLPTTNTPKTREEADINRQVSGARADMDHKQLYGRELTDEEFADRIAGKGLGIESVMPDPPEIEGYDTMWGTTMEHSQGVMRTLLNSGYTYVTREEAPNYKHKSPRSAGIDGLICYNELVALKIKKGRRELLAKQFHHDKPLASEASIRSQISALSDNAKQNTKIRMEEGMREMGNAPKGKPTFSL